jgi:hypothetical protein
MSITCSIALKASYRGWGVFPLRKIFIYLPLRQVANFKEADNVVAKARAIANTAAGKAVAVPRKFGTALSLNSNTANTNNIAPVGKAAIRKFSMEMP